MLCLPIEWAMAFDIPTAQKGGGDLRTGTAGIFVDDCSSSSPVEMQGFLGRMAVTFIVLGEGLPVPEIDFFEDFPLVTLAVANLELVNSL